jgi:hypothetical protein
MSSPIETQDVSQALVGINADYDPAALAEAKAKELADPATFNFIKFLQDGGKTLPTEEVIVYSDLGAALDMQAAKLDNQNITEEAGKTARIAFEAAMSEYVRSNSIADVEPDPEDPKYQIFLPDTYYANVKKIEALQDQLFESRIVLQIKGIPPRVLQIIEANLAKYRSKLTEEKYSKETIDRLYDMRKVVLLAASSVQSYSVPKIEFFSDKKLTPQEAYELLTSLHTGEQQKIVNACLVLTYAVAIADPRTEAGFLGRRAQQTGAATVPVGSPSVDPVPSEAVVSTP